MVYTSGKEMSVLLFLSRIRNVTKTLALDMSCSLRAANNDLTDAFNHLSHSFHSVRSVFTSLKYLSQSHLGCGRGQTQGRIHQVIETIAFSRVILSSILTATYTLLSPEPSSGIKIPLTFAAPQTLSIA